MEKLMNFNYLQESERQTIQTTRAILTGITIHYPIIIDILLKLPYYWGELIPNNTDEAACQSVFSDHYLQLPYSVWGLHNLYEKGYYLEAVIVERHLLELLVQMRYFYLHPSLYQKHTLSISSKDRISFKKMFEEFAPGFYKNHYGRYLSSFAHGSITKSIFRVHRTSPTGGRVVLGCEFNLEHATAIINSVTFILYGFLSLFPMFFPANSLSKNETLQSTYIEELTWLKNYIKELELMKEQETSKNSGSKKWCADMRKIVGISYAI